MRSPCVWLNTYLHFAQVKPADVEFTITTSNAIIYQHLSHINRNKHNVTMGTCSLITVIQLYSHILGHGVALLFKVIGWHEGVSGTIHSLVEAALRTALPLTLSVVDVWVSCMGEASRGGHRSVLAPSGYWRKYHTVVANTSLSSNVNIVPTHLYVQNHLHK